jgi:hypothetical protein
MTVDLESRAREATAALKSSVARASMHHTPPVMAPPAPVLVPLVTAAFTVTAAVLLMIWLVQSPIPVAGQVPTSIPAPASTTSVPMGSSTSTIAPPGATTVVVDSVAPHLLITHPVDGATSTEATIEFRGETEPEALVWAGPYQADVESNGEWRIVLILSPGANRVTFRAVDQAGNQAEASVTVSLTTPTPQAETTTTTSTALSFFDANYTWGTCDLDPPYDEYYGVGEPGSTVTVFSEFGSGMTSVGEDGTWYLKVFFPEAPPGLRFDVSVSDQFGRQETFEFKSTVGW